MVETPNRYVTIFVTKGQIGHQAVMSGKVNRIYRATLQKYIGRRIIREGIENPLTFSLRYAMM